MTVKAKIKAKKEAARIKEAENVQPKAERKRKKAKSRS